LQDDVKIYKTRDRKTNSIKAWGSNAFTRTFICIMLSQDNNNFHAFKLKHDQRNLKPII